MIIWALILREIYHVLAVIIFIILFSKKKLNFGFDFISFLFSLRTWLNQNNRFHEIDIVYGLWEFAMGMAE